MMLMKTMCFEFALSQGRDINVKILLCLVVLIFLLTLFEI